MVGLRLSRAQLAEALGGNFETIKQFEKLFVSVEDNETLTIDILNLATSAGANTNEALAQLTRLADAVETLALAPAPVPVVPADDTAPVPMANNSLATDYIDFPINGPHITRARRMQWNADDGTIDVGLNADVTLQVGQELHYYAKNTSGGTIANGSPVVVTGTLGASGKLEIGLAIADGSIDQRYFIGAATQDIANNDFGYVTAFGLLRGFDASAWTDGDLLYVSDTVAGDWTDTAPASPNWRQPQAIVVHAAANGSIFIRVTPEHKLADLQDVYAPSPVDRQVLEWVSSSGRWEAKFPAVRSITASGNALATDYLILADATSAAITVTLPAASGNSGRAYVVKKTDASANTVTIDGNGAETIDGAATQVITARYDALMIVCDGSGWWIV